MFGMGIDSVLGSFAQKAAQKFLLEEQQQDLIADGLNDTAIYTRAAEEDARRRTVNSPAGFIKSLAKIGGFVAGRSEETEDGTQITLGDPGTSDLADAATGASGLIDLLQGDVNLSNSLDAAGVAFDAGLPGPPVVPMLGAILPVAKVKHMAGTLADATGAMINRGAKEATEDFVARTVGVDTKVKLSQQLPAGTTFEDFQQVLETGNPRTFREILDDIDDNVIDIEFQEPLRHPRAELDLAELTDEALKATKKLPASQRQAVIPKGNPGTVGTAYRPDFQRVEGDPFDVFSTIDNPGAPGAQIIGLSTEVNPRTGLISYVADNPMIDRELANVGVHEIQHAVNSFIPKHTAKAIAGNADTMQNIENIMVAKYGVDGAEHYRRKGIGPWVDEGLAVMGESNNFGLLGDLPGVSDLKEVNASFRQALDAISPRGRTAPFPPDTTTDVILEAFPDPLGGRYELPTHDQALKEVNDQINNWGDRTGTIVFDTKRIR